MNDQDKINKLRVIFNEVDPIGIYFDERNKDEYDSEIKALLESKVNLNDLDSLNKELLRIFRKFFEGISINEKDVKNLAEKVSELNI